MFPWQKFIVIGTSYGVYNIFQNKQRELKLVYCDENIKKEINRKLMFATVYFRHGTRTPLRALEMFPEIKWPKELCEIDTSQEFLPYEVMNAETGELGRPFSLFDEKHRSFSLPVIKET